MDDGIRKMEDGGWMMEDGKWIMRNDSKGNGQRTADKGWWKVESIVDATCFSFYATRSAVFLGYEVEEGYRE